MHTFTPDTIQVGISACLLGQEVRYDGGHKRSAFCSDDLQPFVRYVPVCPEVGAGLGLPRPTIRLEYRGELTRVIRSSDGADVTPELQAFSEQTANQLRQLSGYIFCARSPSCGMERVKVYQENGHSRADEVGVFARAIMQRHPNLPVEENGRLNDKMLRENFITRLFAYHNWRSLRHQGITPQGLIDFHSDYKYLLLAHHQHSYRELGRLLSNLSQNFDAIVEQYEALFMRALKHVATRKNQCNVLQHIHGYFKDKMQPEQRRELAQLIDDYRIGLLPVHAPLTLIQHYLREYPDDYIARQQYLKPHPPELSLRYGL